ncbi:DUF3289 family protein [Lelliottia sp. AC1]|uniref:DUF3289 family protein n=1 Tax=Lelliottia sp. AC1 TaxID=2067959 RepID=UPI002111E9DE|nr:DUF3289 family protein [Lelliottia sp. AC1]
MHLDMYLSTEFPKVIFSTFHRFENYYVSDMQCGDLDDHDFFRLGLRDISEKVDPFRLLEFNGLTSFRPLSADFSTTVQSGRPISQQRCADILFSEMKTLSTQFAFGKYSHLISALIDHFHYGNGTPWHSEQLDYAYKEIIEGIGTNDFLITIIEAIDKQLVYKRQASLNFDFFDDVEKNCLKRYCRNLIDLKIDIMDWVLVCTIFMHKKYHCFTFVDMQCRGMGYFILKDRTILD